jgi:hypothetical protein
MFADVPGYNIHYTQNEVKQNTYKPTQVRRSLEQRRWAPGELTTHLNHTWSADVAFLGCNLCGLVGFGQRQSTASIFRAEVVSTC